MISVDLCYEAPESSINSLGNSNFYLFYLGPSGYNPGFLSVLETYLQN